MTTHTLSGVYAAAVTPLTTEGKPDQEGLLRLLDFLAERGCHGALLLGTTGEGPSFSGQERLAVMRAAVTVREIHPQFRLLAGTGTPSQTETITLTRTAFDLGYDGVVVLPPYYFRGASEDGLFAWFSGVLKQAAPSDGGFLGYHIPPVTGVPLSETLIQRLLDTFPGRFSGIKDSSKDIQYAGRVAEKFGEHMVILNGTDTLFSRALDAGVHGAITALANLLSPDLRAVWDAHQEGKNDPAAQARLDDGRKVIESFPPAAPLLKDLLAVYHDFPYWPVKPPLRMLAENTAARARLAWKTRGKIA